MKLPARKFKRSPRRGTRIVATCVALGALAAGTGGAGVSGATSQRTTLPLTISTLTTTKFGTILTSTRTVYTLTPSKVACAAACLKVWPEVLLAKGVMKARAGRGINAAKLGTIARAGGRRQVTYAGRALYWFIGDTRPSQVNGNVTDTWGKWSVVVLVKPAVQKAPTTTTTSGGGGGGIGF